MRIIKLFYFNHSACTKFVIFRNATQQFVNSIIRDLATQRIDTIWLGLSGRGFNLNVQHNGDTGMNLTFRL